MRSMRLQKRTRKDGLSIVVIVSKPNEGCYNLRLKIVCGIQELAFAYAGVEVLALRLLT